MPMQICCPLRDEIEGRSLHDAIDQTDAAYQNTMTGLLKGIDYCPVEIIKGLTDKGQFQYLTNLKGPQVGNYLYTTQFRSLI